jgi:serine/threonine-protein kinase SRPK3
MMYELLTGDLLFHPRQSDSWSKNEDHLAQMQELVGPFHSHYLARSPKRNRYFEKDGSMRKFPTLTHYPFATVLQIKNKITAE